jgi:hypothetical protein
MCTKHLCCMLLVPQVPPNLDETHSIFRKQTSEHQSPRNSWLALAGWPARPGGRSAVPGRAHRSTQLI